MTPTEFRDAWRALAYRDEVPATFRAEFAELSTMNAAAITPTQLSQIDLELLTVVGLPRSAAPFLTFGDDLKFLDVLRREERIRHLVEGLAQIGSDGAGNPICLEAPTGHVVLVDHDNEFRRQFVNSSVMQLAESLVVYGSFRGDVSRWTAQIRDADAAAMDPATFWDFEAQIDSSE